MKLHEIMDQSHPILVGAASSREKKSLIAINASRLEAAPTTKIA